MKLEESQALHNELSEKIIETQKKRIELRRKLQSSNETFQKTKEVQLQPWQFKNINDEIDILAEEIKNLEEQRSLVERGLTSSSKKQKN